MISQSQPRRTLNTYNNGRPYIPARGRYAPREALEDHLAPCHPVVTRFTTPEAFYRQNERGV